MKSISSFLGWLLPVAVVLAFLGTGGHAMAKAKWVNPTNLKVTYDARIATDGQDVWMAAISSGAWGSYFVQVSRYSDGKWTVLPGRPATVAGPAPFGGVGIQFAVFRAPGATESTPCIGDSPKAIGRVRCLENGSWQTLSGGGAFDDMTLSGLEGDRSSAIALFTHAEHGQTSVRLARITGGSLVPAGPVLNLEGEVDADLGEKTTDVNTTDIDVGLEGQTPPVLGRRSLATLGSSGWTLSNPLPKLAEGVQVSGPVRTARSVLFPAVNGVPSRSGSAVSNWPFSIFNLPSDTWAQSGGKAVSRGKGASIGGVFAVGTRSWTVWTTIAMKHKRLVATKYAARLSADGTKLQKRLRLSQGSLGDNSTAQAIGYKGRPVFFYTRSGRRGPVFTVDFSHK